jgi:hypothetical protein
MSEPIPRSLLRHSITYYPYTGMVNSIDTFGAGVVINFVRVEPIKKNFMNSQGDMKNDAMKVFYDCNSSAPKTIVFKAKDRIVFGAFSLKVRTAVPQYGDDVAIHHYEVLCV